MPGVGQGAGFANTTAAQEAAAASQAEALSLIADVAASEEGSAASHKALAEALQQLLGGAADQLQVLHEQALVKCGWDEIMQDVGEAAQRPSTGTQDPHNAPSTTSPAASEAVQAPSEASEPGQPSLPALDLLNNAAAQLHSLDKLLQLLQKCGLTHLLAGAQGQSADQAGPASSFSPDAAQAALEAGSMAMACGSAAVQALQLSVVPDLAGHAHAGSSPVLQHTVAALKGIWQQLEGLIWESVGLQARIHEYESLLGSGYETQTKVGSWFHHYQLLCSA